MLFLSRTYAKSSKLLYAISIINWRKIVKKTNTRYITQAALIAAAYTALSLVLAPISFGPIQVRVAEALTVLPAIFPSAIPGLFVGCILTNTIGTMLGLSGGILDIVFGSLATLISAWISYKLKKYTYLVPLPPVVINAVVVGMLLYYVVKIPLPLSVLMLQVGAGQLIACYVLGLALLLWIKRLKKSKEEIL